MTSKRATKGPTPLRAVITGAGAGLGRALAMELADRGASLMLSDIEAEGLEETARQARFREVAVHTRICDVRDRDAVFALEAQARAELGAIDLLVNNAGVAVAGPFEQISLEDWRWIVDINLWGVVYGCQAFVPDMRARGAGRILNVASAAGLLNPPTMAPYNLTKAAVVSLSETLHAELRPAGVGVSVLCPTFFVTGIARNSRGAGDDADRRRIERLMQRSKKQAPEVARDAIEGTLRGDLHILPMTDGRVMWGLKRALPGRFADVLDYALRPARGRRET